MAQDSSAACSSCHDIGQEMEHSLPAALPLGVQLWFLHIMTPGH